MFIELLMIMIVLIWYYIWSIMSRRTAEGRLYDERNERPLLPVRSSRRTIYAHFKLDRAINTVKLM